MEPKIVIDSVLGRDPTVEPNGTVFWIFVAAIVLIVVYKIYSAVMEQKAINAKNEFRRSRQR
jgi:hypothetical protein